MVEEPIKGFDLLFGVEQHNLIFENGQMLMKEENLMTKIIQKSILPKPDMNYDRIHLVMAWSIILLAVLGMWKIIELMLTYI